MKISERVLDVLKIPWTNHITSEDHGKSGDLVLVTASNQHYFRGMYPINKMYANNRKELTSLGVSLRVM